MKMFKTVSEFFEKEYSLRLGDSYNIMEQKVIEITIDDITFFIHPVVDLTNNNEIVILSIRFLTEDKQSLVNALRKLKKFFNLNGVPDIDINSKFYTASMYSLDYIHETGETLKLVLWDRISSMLNRYEIELKIEKDKYVA
jgi:hypothetical protein